MLHINHGGRPLLPPFFQANIWIHQDFQRAQFTREQFIVFAPKSSKHYDESTGKSNWNYFHWKQFSYNNGMPILLKGVLTIRKRTLVNLGGPCWADLGFGLYERQWVTLGGLHNPQIEVFKAFSRHSQNAKKLLRCNSVGPRFLSGLCLAFFQRLAQSCENCILSTPRLSTECKVTWMEPEKGIEDLFYSDWKGERKAIS